MEVRVKVQKHKAKGICFISLPRSFSSRYELSSDGDYLDIAIHRLIRDGKVIELMTLYKKK